MEILFVIHSLRGGGTGRVCAALANALVARGHRVTVAVNLDEKTVWRDSFAESVAVLQIGGTHARSSIGRLSRVVSRLEPQTILAFNYQLAIALLFVRDVRRIRGAPGFRLVSRHIVALTESARIKGFWHRFMIRTVVLGLYRRMDCVVAQSQGMYDDLVENFGVSPDRSTVIHNPVLPDTVRERGAAGESLPIELKSDAAEVPVVLYLGRFKPQKQPFLLLDIAERLRQEIPRLLLVAGGDGPLLEGFLAAVRERSLEETVHHAGYVRDTTPFFERAAVTVLTSAYEGFPNVLIDSISHGTPVVSFDCPTGPGEIVQDGINGYLIGQNDVEAMAQGVMRLIRAPLRRDAVKHTSTRFSLQHAVDQYEEVLRG